MKLPDLFVMTLQHCDMSVAKDGPEIWIPVTARRMVPEFWGWPDKYERPKSTAKKSLINQRSREIVLEFHGKKYASRVWGYATKTEFRIRSEEIRSAINEVDDLLLLLPNPDSGADFLADVLHKDNDGYEKLIKGCTHKAPVEASLKHFNYFTLELEPCPVRRRWWMVIHHREEQIDYAPFIKKSEADDYAKAIRKSNGVAEVVPATEDIEL